MTRILAFLGTPLGYYTSVALFILAIAGVRFCLWLRDRRTRPEVIDDMLPIVFTYRGRQLTADQVLSETGDDVRWDGLTSELNRLLAEGDKK